MNRKQRQMLLQQYLNRLMLKPIMLTYKWISWNENMVLDAINLGMPQLPNMQQSDKSIYKGCV